MTVRIIGDVHGKIKEYLGLIQGCEYSIQVGDLAFDYSFLDRVDANRHRVIPGNHDNYDDIEEYNHFYPRYGPEKHGGLEFFYVRGAFSIDFYGRLHERRIGGSKTWWEEEELNFLQLASAIELYGDTKPQVVLSHDCPRPISKKINDGSVLKKFGYYQPNFMTYTGIALQKMFEIHKPERWIFGHYHKSFNKRINGTLFTCLAELEYIDL